MNKPDGFQSGFAFLELIVPMTKLSDNYMNLESWLSKLPEGDFKVVLVHDVQDLDTGTVLNRILREVNDQRVKLCEGKFGAPGLARNFGMGLINSTWTWFVDADDLPEISTVLEELGATTENEEVVIGQYLTDISGRRSKAKQVTTPQDLIEVARNPGIWRMVFRSRILSACKFREFRMAEDQLFIIDLNIFEKSIRYSKQIFYTYFKHSAGQLTSQQSAIRELSETIPVVAGKIRSKTDSNHNYFEVILARQIATLVKNSNQTSIRENVMRNIALICKLNKRSQLRIFLEFIKIPILKLKKRSNE